jgi:transposase-like protein
MMMKIKCPKCETEGSFSLVESSYNGPYKCWKCRELFTIEIKNNEVQSFKPLTQEEFDKQQELKTLRDRFRRS